MENNLINFIPKTLVDDYFVAGFISGFIGFLFYHYTNQDNANNHITFFAGIYGAFLSACVGGILAIIFDQSIELALIVGLFAQFIYLAMINSAKSGKFLENLLDIMIRIFKPGKPL